MNPAGLVVGRAQIDESIQERDGRSVEPRILSRKSASFRRTHERNQRLHNDGVLALVGLRMAWAGQRGRRARKCFSEAIDCPCRKGAARLSAPAQERHAPGAHPGGELGGGVLSGAAGRHLNSDGSQIVFNPSSTNAVPACSGRTPGRTGTRCAARTRAVPLAPHLALAANASRMRPAMPLAEVFDPRADTCTRTAEHTRHPAHRARSSSSPPIGDKPHMNCAKQPTETRAPVPSPPNRASRSRRARR